MNYATDLLTCLHMEPNATIFADSPYSSTGSMGSAVQSEELLADLFGAGAAYCDGAPHETKVFASPLTNTGLLPSPDWDDSLSFSLPTPPSKQQQNQQQHLTFNFVPQTVSNTQSNMFNDAETYLPYSPSVSPGPFSPNAASSEPPSPDLEQLKGELAISDNDLLQLPVRELNRLIKALQIDGENVARLKQRRRTLKNRGYAHNCRQRRQAMRSTLHTQHMSLEKQLIQAVHELNEVKQERDSLKHETEALKKQLHGISIGVKPQQVL
eukprot:scpid67478/ scgid31203/ Transcription factor MafA